MKTLQRNAFFATVLGLMVASAQAQVSSIDSVVVKMREFNDISTATVVSGGAYPSGLFFLEFGVSAPSGFANRDLWRFSAGGVDAYTFGNDEFFQVTMDVTLAGFPPTPRKEAGFLLTSTIGGEGQFIVNTDAHEVVAFGGPFPFYAFPATFDSGEKITLGMKYFLDPGTGMRSIIYSANGVESPALPFTNLEQGIIDGSMLGGYMQIVNYPANPSNTGFAMFNNITIEAVPEPGTLALFALGMLLLLRHRKG
jgi:hypothetical protein